MKFINVISVSDGNEKDLKSTIKSVKNQNYKHYKHIIVAKKLSKKFFNKHKSKKIKFIIGKDRSIYNAMNIAENLSFNNYSIYLNSGDIFFSKNSLKIISKNLKFKKNFQFVSVLKFKNIYFYPKKNYFYNKKTLTHSSFVRSPISKNKTIFFNENFLITADGNWMSENIKINGIKKVYIPISIFSLDGVSTLPSIKTIKMKKNTGYKNLIKEVLKYIILKFTTREIFYKLIYSYKYIFKNEKISKKYKINK